MRSLVFWLQGFNKPRTGADNCLKGLGFLGVGFVLTGVLLVIFPQLLAWLLAGLLIVTGMGLLGLAWVGQRWLEWWVREAEDERRI